MLAREDEEARFPGPMPLFDAVLLVLLRVSRDAR